MSKETLILVGGGGHCRSCIDVIEQEGRFEIAGIVDRPEQVGGQVLGYPILGSDEDLPALVQQYAHFIITIGQLKHATIRQRLYEELVQLGANLPTIISPLAYCSKHSELGAGTIVLHHALVNAGTKVGVNCIVNTKALLEHDVEVGDHNHLSTACTLNGGVKVGNGCTIGSRVVTLQGISIGDEVIVGAGAVVHRNLTQAGIYVGVPAKRLQL